MYNMTFYRLSCVISLLSLINTVFAQHQGEATRFVFESPSPYTSGNAFIDTYYGSQRYALACLFFATNQKSNRYIDTDEALLEPWKVTTNWISDVGECEWHGVTCDENNFVTGIDLSGNNLGGIFPNEFLLLGSTLNYLDISSNPTGSFSGGNFWISEMQFLTHLDLHNTNFDGRGLPDISNLVYLQYLDLSFTYFWFDLDEDLFANLDQLETLDISGNSYPGQVPAGIYNLPSLKRLYIYDSDFTGSMDFINELSEDLVEIWADGNFWDEGPIPTGITQFNNLKGLSLTYAGRTGRIPAGLGDLEELQRVWLYGNSLTGAIPNQISNLDRLIIFQVEDNNLNGDMPSEVCDLFDNPFGPLKVVASDCTSSGGSVNCPCCNCCEAPCDCDSEGCAGDEPPPAAEFCFSGESTVDVLNKGTVKMEDLKIGDKVLVGPGGKYEPIYSFGHFDTSVVKTEFIQIRTSTSSGLEMTPNHLIFTERNKAVPASSIKVGDKVLMASGETDTVISIEEVKRTGIFAPFTSSGTIVTNGILSSSFATIQKSHYVSLGGLKIPLTYHQLGVVFESPHRLLCNLWGLDQCARYERYDEGGTSQWVKKPMVGFQWLLEQNIVVSGILFLIAFAFLCMVNLIEMLVVSPMHIICLMVAFVADRRRRRVKKML